WLAARFYGLPEDFTTGYARHIGAVDLKAVSGAVQRWITPDRAAVVVVGPAERLRAQLEPLGAVEVLQGGGTVAGPPPASPEQRKRGRELLDQALQAHGGRARLEGIRRSNVTSQVALGMGPLPVRGTLTIMRIEPDRMVLLTDVQGQHSRQILEGNRAWSEVAEDSTGAHEGDSTAVT